jgi:uncharacterized membrane protein (DUF106 family)
MNWLVIVIVAVVMIALIVFMVKRNLIDKKELESKLKRDYRKPGDSDVEIDEKLK